MITLEHRASLLYLIRNQVFGSELFTQSARDSGDSLLKRARAQIAQQLQEEEAAANPNTGDKREGEYIILR